MVPGELSAFLPSGEKVFVDSNILKSLVYCLFQNQRLMSAIKL
jgi:hypothetical protein